MATQKFNSDIDVSGEVKGTSLDINGAADVSGDVRLNTGVLKIGGVNAKLLELSTDTSGIATIETTGDSGSDIEIISSGDVGITSNQAIDLSATIITSNANVFNFSGAALSASAPIMSLTNNTNDATGPEFKFTNNRDGNGLNDGDGLGRISFSGDDDGGTLVTANYGLIQGFATESADGDEAGKIVISVANDATQRNGITMTGDKSTAGQVDVAIANGAASTTAVAGTLTMGSTATLNNTGQIQVASQPSITTLAGLTSLGAAGATTDIAAGDLTMYNAVNDGAPTISIGSSATERLEITALYANGTQQVSQALFKTYTGSSTSNRGRFVFSVDETTALQIWDAGLNLSASKALQINGTNIISDNSGTATLSNIDALDATTEATIEAAMDTLPNVTSLGTLTGLTTSGAIELGHASDTTIARSAAGTVTIEGDQIVTDGAVNVASGASAPIAMRVARRTITQAEMNALHTTPIELIPAPGANKVIVITAGGNYIMADRAATNTAASTLGVGFDGFTETYSALYARRFMMGVTTDILWNLNSYTSKVATVLTDAVNKKVEVKFFGACTTNCFTSVDVIVNYYILDLS